ncbi:hypothetical protein SALBM217S_08287 [Streptomyces griseoloalbus]
MGAAAEIAAQRLGLRPFGPQETGTTVVVIDPNLDEFEQPTDAADYLAETIAWHLWPKMIETDGKPPAMRFSVTCDGVPYEVPDPRTTPPLHMFVKAYEVMKGGQGRDLACLKPKRHLGRLGLDKRIMPALERSRAKELLDIEDVVHHVCLMRPAELVVTYRPGPKPPSIHQGYAGVFRADESMDEVYAKAEPPTHDAWNPHSLERPESTYVATTFRRIDEALNGLLSLNGNAGQGASTVALGAASSYFSGLVGGGMGHRRSHRATPSPAAPRPGRPTSTAAVGARTAAHEEGPGLPEGRTVDGEDRDDAGAPYGGDSTPRRRPRVQYVGDPYYEDHGESTLLVQEFRLPVPGPQRVRSDLAVTLPGTGGRETDPPLGATMPVLVGWQDASGHVHDGDPCVVEGSEAVWRALVRPAPDTMTEIGIKVEAVKEQ